MTAENGSGSPAASAGPALVLLSGMLGDESLWAGVLERFDATNEVLCLRSDSGSTVRQVAQAVLDSAPGSFALAGHSFGGIVALEVQRQAPHRVVRLALLSASARPGSLAQQRNWSAIRSRASAGEFATVAQELALATLPPHHRTPGLVAHNLAMAEVVGAAGLLRQLTAQADRPDSRPTLAGIAVPTLVAVGERDEVCPPDLQHEVADGIPGSRTVTITGAGHMSPLEAPDEVANAMRRWLARADVHRHEAAPTEGHPGHPRSHHVKDSP